MMSDIALIACGKHEDARGVLRFCNDFDMREVMRFYTIANSSDRPKRGWIMHKRETKWFFPLCGITVIHAEPADGSRAGDPLSYVLSAEAPAVLCVPPGNWFLIEQDGASAVQVFSNCRAGEFKDDDFRRACTE